MLRSLRFLFVVSAVLACGDETSRPPQPLVEPPEHEVPVEARPAAPAAAASRVRVSLPSPIRIDVATERAVDAAVARALAEDQIPGAVVLIGDAQGTRFARAYGKRSLEPGVTRMTLDTEFDLASLSKVFTALGVLRLVAAGRLSLEEDAGRIVPALAGVSAEDLLLHRAGFPAVDSLDDYVAERQSNIERILTTPRNRPGRFHYSDLGYIALGEIIARVSEKPLDEALHELVFEPLGLKVRFRPEESELIAPTEYAPRRAQPGADPPMIRGEVHDPRAYRLGGVAGHAGLFASGSDIAKVARMLLGGESDFLPEPLRRRMLTPVRMGDAERGLGLDAFRSGFAHRGFTGTFLHVHPSKQRFAVVLTHAVHPRGQGDAAPLRDDVRRLANQAAVLPDPAELAFGIDVLRADEFRLLEGKRVGLFTHDAAVARDGMTTRRLLQDAENVDLRLLFAPEHGLGANREGTIGDERADGVLVESLFGANRDPRPESFEHFDVLVVDVQDVGTRFYTYFASMHRLLRAAADAHRPVVILDRPNPLGGERVEGPLVEPAHQTFINHHSLPIIHGLSAGEMARLLVAEEQLDVDLEVVVVQGWRGETWRELNLRWVPPSPNLRSLAAVELYPAVALVEGANVSVGRGTVAPFQLVGAPYVDAERLMEAVVAAGGHGELARFRPSARPYRNRWCRGVRLRPAGASLRLGFAILSSLATHPEFEGERTAGLLASDLVLEAALGGRSGLIESFEAAETAFESRRAPFLLYERSARAAQQAP